MTKFFKTPHMKYSQSLEQFNRVQDWFRNDTWESWPMVLFIHDKDVKHLKE